MPLFQSRRDHASPKRFRQHEYVAYCRAGIGEHTIWMNQAGDSVTKLDLPVTDAVSSDDDATSLRHLREAAPHYLLKDVQIAVLGEADQRERGERAATHCVHITECIGGRDPAKCERIVYERCEEIDSLHECGIGVESVDARIIRRVEADQ